MPPKTIRTKTSLRICSVALYFGVATVMSQGIEKGDISYRVRADQQAGRIGGARMRIAGLGIGEVNAGPGAPEYANIAYEVTSEAEIRDAVRESAATRVDAIKIWVDDRGGRAPRMPPALFRAAIDENTATDCASPRTCSTTPMPSNWRMPASTASPTSCATESWTTH